MATIIISVLFLDAILLLDAIVTGTVLGARRNIWNILWDFFLHVLSAIRGILWACVVQSKGHSFRMHF